MCSHGEGAAHDCAYVDERNRALDAADAHARRETGVAPKDTFASTRSFLGRVNEIMGTTGRPR